VDVIRKHRSHISGRKRTLKSKLIQESIEKKRWGLKRLIERWRLKKKDLKKSKGGD